MARQLGQREALVSLKGTAMPSSPGGSLDSGRSELLTGVSDVLKLTA